MAAIRDLSKEYPKCLGFQTFSSHINIKRPHDLFGPSITILILAFTSDTSIQFRQA